MFDFLTATGIFGAIGLSAVFIVVFLLAKPGEEISFWGIKFHKKYKQRQKKGKRIPKTIPNNWFVVFEAFSRLDNHNISLSSLYSEIRKNDYLSDIEARNICMEMQEYGLVRIHSHSIYLCEKALSLVVSVKNRKTGKFD